MKSAWSIIHEKLEGWWLYSVRMLPNFILAAFILLVFFLMSRILRKVVYNFVLRISKSISVSSMISGVVYLLVFLSGVMSALDILELDKTVSSLLAGVGIIGLALGFAFQDITSNFISGAFIALKRPFDVGHKIETNGFTGTIEEIQLRSTTLRTEAGLHVNIPNKDIFQKPIINYTRSELRNVVIEFVLPAQVEPSYAEDLIRSSLISSNAEKLYDNIQFFYTALENPNVRIQVSFWTSQIDPVAFQQTRHKAIQSILTTLQRSGIYEVKYPVRKESPSQNG
jgi:small conductance mechanosensitive channel